MLNEKPIWLPPTEPGAQASIDAVMAGDIDVLLTTVLGFRTPEEAFVLLSMLWYAYESGVSVTFVGNQVRS